MANQPNVRADLDLEFLDFNTESKESFQEKLNRLINSVNFLNKSLSLQSNFNCFIAKNVKFEAAGDAQERDVVKIQHFLGVVPLYRLILRQVGNGVLTDVANSPSDWGDKVITLRNNGTVPVTATIMVVRE
jgi:hypothetical protein